MDKPEKKPVDPSDLHYQFLIEEYKTLKQEIENNVLQLRRIIYLNVLGCGALWYFILDSLNKDKSMYSIIYWIPFILCTLCGLYFIALRRDVQRIGHYILGVETEMLKKDSKLGWEHFIVDIPQTFLKHTYKFEIFHWIVLLIINLIGAFILQFKF